MFLRDQKSPAESFLMVPNFQSMGSSPYTGRTVNKTRSMVRSYVVVDDDEKVGKDHTPKIVKKNQKN